jgi:type I restriction enzyme S subunit
MSGSPAKSRKRWAESAMRSELTSGWIQACLGDHVELQVGFAFKSTGFTDAKDAIRLLRGDNIGQGRLRWNGARKWPGDRVAGFEHYMVKPRDVVLAMDRPWIDAGLKYAIVREDDVPCLLVQRVARLRSSATISQGYLSSLVASPAFTTYVRAVQTGTAVPHISGGQIAEFRFRLPPRTEQERIASILGTLDDKIDSNRRLAVLLEETAATLFRGRFVDFVGVEEFEESEIGRVPRGWRAGALTDLARFVNGKAFTKYANGIGRPILRIRELNGGVDDGTLRSDIGANDDFLARFDDILFAWSGSLGIHRWPGDESLINQHIFKVIPDGWPAWFVFAWVREHMETFRGIARDRATTMGHIQRRHLVEAGVPLPPPDCLASAATALDPLDRLRAGLIREAVTLTEIRDELLPKLISGEIRVLNSADPAEVIEPAAAM